MTQDKPTITLYQKGRIVSKSPEIEWYSGKELYTRPIRVKIGEIWEEVFTFEKQIREDVLKQQRKIVFRCHIGDNRIYDVILAYDLTPKEG